MESEQNKLILGVDPGLTTTGLSLVDNGLVFKHKTCTGKEALSLIVNWHTIYNYSRAAVEMPKQGVFYARHLSKKGAVTTPQGMIKLAQNVGMNIQLTKEIIDKLHEIGVRVRECNPKRGTTKWDPGYWTRIFKWESGRVPSSHARDAAVLALMNEKWIGWNLPNGTGRIR